MRGMSLGRTSRESQGTSRRLFSRRQRIMKSLRDMEELSCSLVCMVKVDPPRFSISISRDQPADQKAHVVIKKWAPCRIAGQLIKNLTFRMNSIIPYGEFSQLFNSHLIQVRPRQSLGEKGLCVSIKNRHSNSLCSLEPQSI